MSRGTIFISFDCAYRTLGWCIVSFNPADTLARMRASENPREELRGLFKILGGGVEDVLGAKIEDVSHSDRARLLMRTLERIMPPADVVSRATIIIEHQPRFQCLRGRGSVRGDNQAIEAQLVMYFTAAVPARRIFLIDPKDKDRISRIIVPPESGAAETYAVRKKRSRLAFAAMNQTPGQTRGISADQSDAYLQIIAAIIFRMSDVV